MLSACPARGACLNSHRIATMQTVIEFREGLDTPVLLEQYANGRFRVVYGKDITSNLTYEDACTSLGAALMHSLACKGSLRVVE